MEFERRSASSPVMNTNEIPIKLPERYASRRRQTRVIREDDINDELILERRREEYKLILSFFRVRISIGEKDGGEAKSDEKQVFTKTLLRVFLSLFWSLSLRGNGKASTASLVLARCTATASFPKRFFRTHNTFLLKYLIEHFKQKRATRWPRRRNTSRN